MQSRAQRRPLVLYAPHDEASFASLPYVQELLHYSARVDAATTSTLSLMTTSRDEDDDNDSNDDDDWCGVMTATQLRDVDAATVRRRMARERACEQHFAHATCNNDDNDNKKSSSSSSREDEAMSPLLLLRIGLSRALGLSAPCGDGDAVDEVVLCRRRVAVAPSTLHSSDNSSNDGRCYYVDDDDALRRAAVVEWFEDVLSFVRQMDLNVLQVRSVLCDAVGLLHALQHYAMTATTTAITTTASDDDDEAAAVRRVVCDYMRQTVIARAASTRTTALRRRVQRQAVTRYVRDGGAVAALEHRLQTEKLNKKQQAQLQAQLERVPLLPSTVYEQHVVDDACDVRVAALFDADEAAAVLHALTHTTLTHWRLLCFVLCSHTVTVDDTRHLCRFCTRATPVTLVRTVEDVLPCSVPPLHTFVTADAHARAVAHDALWRDACAAAEALYNAAYARELDALAADEAAARAALHDAKAQAQQRDRADALDAAAYDAVQRAFALRTQRTLQHNDVAEATRGKAVAPAATADTVTTTTAVAAAAAAATPPRATTFVLDDVERRVCAVEAVVQQQQQQQLASTSAAGDGAGGGRRKRLGRG